MALQQHLPGAAKPGDAKLGKVGHRSPFNFEKRVETAAGGLQAGAVYQVQKIGDDHFRLRPVGHGRRQRGKSSCRIACHRGTQDGDGVLPPGTAKHVGNPLGAQRVRRHRRRLVEKRQRITDRAFGGPRDGGDGLGVGADGFTLADSGQMGGKLVRRHPPQIESLAP